MAPGASALNGEAALKRLLIYSVCRGLIVFLGGLVSAILLEIR